jgi:hypothetical protein
MISFRGLTMNDYERDPYKLFMMLVFVFAPAAELCAFDTLAGAVLHEFPVPFGHILLGALIFTAGLSLYGIVRNRTVRGMLYERAGQMGLTLLLWTYGVWGFWVVGIKAIGFSGLLIFLGCAALFRVLQIERRRLKLVPRNEWGPVARLVMRREAVKRDSR